MSMYTMKNDTPRTSAQTFLWAEFQKGHLIQKQVVPEELSKQLERELNAERENVQTLESQLNIERNRRQKLWEALQAARDLLDPDEFQVEIENIQIILEDTQA